MKQLKLDFLDKVIDNAKDNYSSLEEDFPKSEMDSIIISYNSPIANGFSILNESGNESWTRLIVEFTRVLNKAGFEIDIEILESCMKTLIRDYTIKLHNNDVRLKNG